MSQILTPCFCIVGVDKRRLLSPIVKKSCDYHGIKNYTSMEPESEQVISSPVHNAIEATPKEKEKLDGSENNQLQACENLNFSFLYCFAFCMYMICFKKIAYNN